MRKTRGGSDKYGDLGQGVQDPDVWSTEVGEVLRCSQVVDVINLVLCHRHQEC